jgi:PIN like domain
LQVYPLPVIEGPDTTRVNFDELPGQAPRSAIAKGDDVSPRHNVRAGGIFDGGFDTYRTVTNEDYLSLLTSGLIVLDANALLNLYRYHTKTREDLIDILNRLKGRLWVPHQAMFEFWQGRASVIASHSRETEAIIDGLLTSRSELEGGIRKWANRVGLPLEKNREITNVIESAVDHVINNIREMGEESAFEDAEDTAKDPVITALSSILEGSVGSPLPPDELRKVKKEAVQRIADKKPPGWKDAGKKDNPDGDYIIWYQTLQEAKRRRVDVLLVTGDVKDDWWRKEHGEVKGPLPELVYEMRIIANVRLLMLRPASFLLHAGNVLGLKISKESVQDAQRVSNRSEVARNISLRNMNEIALLMLSAISGIPPAYRAASFYNELHASVVELIETLESDRDPLGPAWSVINQGIRIGIFDHVDDWNMLEPVRELHTLLEALYSAAIKIWIDELVVEHLRSSGGRDFGDFYYAGPFPPLVTGVDAINSGQLNDDYKITFKIYTENGRIFTIGRIVRNARQGLPLTFNCQ